MNLTWASPASPPSFAIPQSEAGGGLTVPMRVASESPPARRGVIGEVTGGTHMTRRPVGAFTSYSDADHGRVEGVPLTA